jgi:hypothetical protein
VIIRPPAASLRPGAVMVADDDIAFERKSATEMFHIRRAINVLKDSGMTTE